ncbi:MAG: hypothetical protein DSM106950_13830 [Stigonema ocellatum SAG 48.90 = DSM 106950]|nr:hypothetical protein [Stigonema ocellatum SAG 48.90 = DSM 106950]
MSQNTDDGFVNNPEKVELHRLEKKSPVQWYRQNLFSTAWSKLSLLFKDTDTSIQPEVLDNDEFKYYNRHSDPEQHFYCRFTDRVDPSVYYTTLFYHERF